MFKNTTLLIHNTGSAVSTTETSIHDGPTAGRTIRKAVGGTKVLTISQGQSNENPGFRTGRSTIRLADTKPVSESDKSVDGYVQLTLSFPNEGFLAEDKLTLINELINFVLLGDVDDLGSDLDTPTDVINSGGVQRTPTNAATLTRLLDGEP
jgi:hypothetical protein